MNECITKQRTVRSALALGLSRVVLSLWQSLSISLSLFLSNILLLTQYIDSNVDISHFVKLQFNFSTSKVDKAEIKVP